MFHPPSFRRPTPSRHLLTKRQLVILGAATALGPLSIDLYLPAFPDLARELHTSAGAVQLTLSACVLGLALGQLVAGPISDAVGRRVPIAVGLGCWSVASLACALAPSIGTFTVLRFAQGLAGAVGMVVARASVRDAVHGPALVRAFARLMLVVGVVPVAAPTVGGLLLTHTGWRGLFVGLAVVGLAIAALVVFALQESLPEDRRSRNLRRAVGGYRVLGADRAFLGAAAVVALTFSALLSYVSNSSFVFRGSYDLSPQQFGLLFGLNSVGLIAGNQLSAALAHRWPSRVMLPVALGSAVLATVLIAVAGLVPALGTVGVVLPLFLTIFAMGAALPLASSSAMNSHPERAGAASALLGVLQFAAAAVVSPLAALLGSGILPLAALMGACLLAAMAVHRWSVPSAAAPA